MAKRKVLDYIPGVGLAEEVDTENDKFCPTRHPIFREKEMSTWDLTRLRKPTEFYFTSEAVGYLYQRDIVIKHNKWINRLTGKEI